MMALFEKKKKAPQKKALIGSGTDYDVYEEKPTERMEWFFLGMLAGGAVLYIFYESWPVSVIVGFIAGLAFIGIRRKQKIRKRKKELNLQFRGLLDTLATSIGAGRNMYDSFAGAEEDLVIQFGKKAPIVKEVQLIRSGLDNNYQIEELLMNFAERSGLEDVKNFANVFATCYKKGGNIKDVIKNTASIIGDKIEIQMELETMVAGQKTDQNIMLVMPVIFIVVMKSMGGSLIDLDSPSGVLSVSIALVIFILAYAVSKKILDIKL